jgi:hypothetical protein
VGEPLIHLVAGPTYALRDPQYGSICQWPDRQLHLINLDRQLAAIADADRYRPLRPVAHLPDYASPRADLAYLFPQLIPAQSPQLDEGERNGQAGENRADSCYGRPYQGPVRRITIVELVRSGPGLGEPGVPSRGRTRYAEPLPITVFERIVHWRPARVLRGGLIGDTHYHPVAIGPCSIVWINYLIHECLPILQATNILEERLGTAVVRLIISFVIPRIGK